VSARSLTVGTVQVTAVCDVTGDFPAPLGRAFPMVAPAAWPRWRRCHPEAFGGSDRWRLRDWCFVVRARDRVVLVDTGVGDAGTPGADWIGTPGRLPEELAAAGVEPDEIDLVVLTHLHLDHIGWNLAWDGDRPRPRFGRARYLVQRADWGPASDVQPELAAATRRRLLDEVESGRGWLAPAHFPDPFGTVERADGVRHWAGRR
jgi:glyoxylase-like metal-dependent hydrolase (beta-lactamase superfamily II)